EDKERLINAFEAYIKEEKEAHDPNSGFYPDDSAGMTAFKTGAKLFWPNDIFLYHLERTLIDARLRYWQTRRKIFERDQMRALEALDLEAAQLKTSLIRKREIFDDLKPAIQNRIRYNALMYRYENGVANSERYRS